MMGVDPNEAGIALLALATVYAIVREILVPIFRRERQDRRQDDKPGHFKCEAGRFDQRLTMLEEHSKTGDRRVDGLDGEFAAVNSKLGEVERKLDVVVERVDWLVKSKRDETPGG